MASLHQNTMVNALENATPPYLKVCILCTSAHAMHSTPPTVSPFCPSHSRCSEMLLHTLLFMSHQSTSDHAFRWPQSHVTTASSFTPPSVKAYVAACRREVESQGRTS